MAITRGGRVTGNLLRGVVDDNVEHSESNYFIDNVEQRKNDYFIGLTNEKLPLLP